MTRRLERDQWATLVVDCIDDITTRTGVPVNATDVGSATGLTYMQVMAGVAWARDNYPQLPLLSSKRGYIFSADAAAVATFRLWRARTATTVMRRLLRGAIVPYLRGIGDTAVTRATQRQFERAIEDLEALVTP